MTIDQLKKQLCEAGRELVRKELVARTWGNFSVKIDDDYFLITPSGRSYENLLPEEIVTINIADLSYHGKTKPSSEKELHARIYLQERDVLAIVHTHQFWASAVSAARRSIPVTDKNEEKLLGIEVPCAPYALPTTSRLARSVQKTLVKFKTRAVLLANHGAVCMGKSMAEAVEVAVTLEEAARVYVLGEFRQLQGNPRGNEAEMIEYYLENRGRAR
ncbi:MAG: class II aldolase/adducin family protein [Spirochaetales bacterium]|nr:class II aldolase/adducin family protein [Spirochaetales bacterium]